ncbi:hypothetical protein H8959_014317 [Pygathrix nigripes]
MRPGGPSAFSAGGERPRPLAPPGRLGLSAGREQVQGAGRGVRDGSLARAAAGGESAFVTRATACPKSPDGGSASRPRALELEKPGFKDIGHERFSEFPGTPRLWQSQEENSSVHSFTGYCFTKPELIFTLEQGEDPWLLEKEKGFLSRNSPEDSQPDEISEKSPENQGKHFWQVLFTNKLLTTEQEISGKPHNRDINIFPPRMMPCKCDTVGSAYRGFSPTALHCQYSKEKAREHNVCDKWLISIKDGRTNTQEKSFAYKWNGGKPWDSGSDDRKYKMVGTKVREGPCGMEFFPPCTQLDFLQ